MKKLITKLTVIAIVATMVCHNFANAKLVNVVAEFAPATTMATEPYDVPEDEVDDFHPVVEETVETEPAATEPVEIAPVRFSDEISIEYRGFVDDGEHIAHYVFAPSVESDYDIPLIIWLHGSGEVGVGQSVYESNGIMPTLLNWELSGVNAYIVCPQLVGEHNWWRWNVDRSAENLENLIVHLVETYNIDESRIYIAGHSLGGQGTMYMASVLSEYFAACASLSPYNCGINPYTTDTTLIAIAGTTAYGEDPASVAAAKVLADCIGEENVYYANSNHGNLPGIVFTADDDADGNADIIEWFFQHEKVDAECDSVETN